MSPTVVSPSQVPSGATGVARWQAVALVDVSAAELGYQRMEALATATRDLGVGLVAFGGPDTFGPGGFAGTSLEGALPVDMAVKNPEEESTVAVVLVLETVESTGGDVVMRSAVKRLVANLSPQDLVGVTDGLTGMVVPLQPRGQWRQGGKEIAGIKNFGDPPSYVPYLRMRRAGPERALGGHQGHSPDGRWRRRAPLGLLCGWAGPSGDHVVRSRARDERFAGRHGPHVDHGRGGQGRFYESSSIDQIPSILLAEARSELQPWIVRERFRMTAGASSAALDGIDPYSLPPLDGYVAATTKPASQVVLSGPDGDPILAQWQYGLGKAAAWTSDTGGRWSAELLRSALAGKLFAGIVASTLPLVAVAALSLSARGRRRRGTPRSASRRRPLQRLSCCPRCGAGRHGFGSPPGRDAPGASRATSRPPRWAAT